MVKNPKSAQFYLLPKIHKRLENVPGRPVISNCRLYTENISGFLDFHLQPLVGKVKSHIKDTNDFLKKLHSLTDLPSDITLCSEDIVCLYHNIPHGEDLPALQNCLKLRAGKKVSTSTLVEPAEIVLKNNAFTFGKKNFKTNTRNRNKN